MESKLSFFVCILIISELFSQAPQQMNYQAVVRDNTGNPVVANTPVIFRFTILPDSVIDIDTLITNQFGLVTTTINNIATIDWANGPKYLRVEIDVNNTGIFTNMGTTQLVSVPYALYSGNSTPGPMGLPGSTGATGETGPTGLAGLPGSPGATGAVGPPGLNGVTGPMGPTGNDGIQGPIGLQGIQGVTGPTGIAGVNGNTGATGPTGSNANVTAANGLLSSGGLNPQITLGGTLTQDTHIDMNSRQLRMSGGSVGIGTNSPTEKLDVDGNIRIRGILLTQSPNYFVSVDDTGRAYLWPKDSLDALIGAGSNNSNPQTNIVSFVSGDTIEAGDCVALGDGVSGVNTIATGYVPPAADININGSNHWFAQTFRTSSGSRAVKAIFLNFSMNGTNPQTPFVCSIRNVVNGIPNGTDINNQVAIVQGPSGSGNYGTDARFIFDPPLVLSPDSTYALIVRVGLNTNLHNIIYLSSNVYQNGNFFTSTNSGTLWVSQPSFDLWFGIYETFTEAGKVYRTIASPSGIGWNITASCSFATGNCPGDNIFYGKNDRYDNAIGIAINSALPGQSVQVQVNGFTNLVNSFPLGRKLFLAMPPGKLGTTGTKSIGISTGNGMIIQVTY